MDGENNGETLLKWMIWGKPTIFGYIHLFFVSDVCVFMGFHRN